MCSKSAIKTLTTADPLSYATSTTAGINKDGKTGGYFFGLPGEDALEGPEAPEAPEFEAPTVAETQAEDEAEEQQVRQTADLQRRRALAARGRRATILTSGQGVTTSAPTQRKTALGA